MIKKNIDMTFEEMTIWVEKEFSDIIELINEDAGEKCKPTFSLNTLNLKSSFGSGIYIRFWKVHKRIIIANAYFLNERKGTLTKLIEILTEYGKNNGYEIIELESCNEKATQYAKKHNYLKGETRNNYYKLINDNKEYLLPELPWI
jgi:hypothetical protein